MNYKNPGDMFNAFKSGKLKSGVTKIKEGAKLISKMPGAFGRAMTGKVDKALTSGVKKSAKVVMKKKMVAKKCKVHKKATCKKC